MIIKDKGKERSQIGQSLVEMTLGFVVLLYIMSGVVDLGRLYFTYIALEDSVAEGALYAAINPDCIESSDGPQCSDPTNARYRAVRASGGSVSLDLNDTGDLVFVEIAVASTTCASERYIRLTGSYNFDLITPVVSEIAGVNPLVITSTAGQCVIEKGTGS